MEYLIGWPSFSEIELLFRSQQWRQQKSDFRIKQMDSIRDTIRKPSDLMMLKQLFCS